MIHMWDEEELYANATYVRILVRPSNGGCSLSRRERLTEWIRSNCFFV